MRNTTRESAAEHSFQVAVLTHALCAIARDVFGKAVDAERAVVLALFAGSAAGGADADLLQWVKAADKLDAYLKCVTEMAMGNREFAVAQRQLEAPLRRSPLPEVRYFLEHFAPSFERTLDELTEIPQGGPDGGTTGNAPPG